MDQSIIKMLKSLWRSLPVRRHRQFKLLGVLTIVTACFEVISLGAVLPFVAVITQPDKVMEYSIVSYFAEAFGIKNSDELIFPLSIVFAVAAVIAGGLRLSLLWGTTQLSNRSGADLSIDLYSRTLYQPYNVHISRSSSQIISGVTQKVGVATGVLNSVVVFITSLFLFVSIISTLIAVDPVIAVSSALIFGLSYAVIGWLTRRRLKANSVIIAREQSLVIKSLQEGLGSIRDVLLDGTQNVYIHIYSKSINKIRQGSSQNIFINQFPRYMMESLGLVSIAAFVLFLDRSGREASESLALLAVLALGAQRLLPIARQLYGHWSNIAGNQAAIADVVALLEQPLPEQIDMSSIEPIVLKKNICFRDVGFRYDRNGPWVLNNINLTIPKGHRIGVIGSTGGGKSTLLDLLMGLLNTSDGDIYIDGKKISSEINRSSWQRSIAHVPQNIYLVDATIAENIACGIPYNEIDLNRVREVAEYAQIAKFIENRPEGYGAFVGERGVRLSGGQRQRIGIARALYKNASVLVFDEATSALDNETEYAIMETINRLSKDLTMLIIAHRLTSLKNCNQIIELKLGAVSRIGSYQDLIGDDVGQDKTYDVQ